VINGLVIVLERFFDPLDFENILKILPILDIVLDRDLVLDAGLDILLDLDPGLEIRRFKILRFDIPLVRTLDRTLDRVLVRFGPLIINL
jgi:hypothetical protein